MIDLEREPLLTLSQASALIPPRRGRRTARSTLLRWILHGKHGVKLDGCRAPAGWMTSAAAVERFLASLAEIDRAARGAAARMEEKGRRADWADAVLDAAGVGKKRA
ncbi:MAG: DUF1580 domain-containing protein [Gemmataceae bacterium]|nr:DUF1580 domain-containing protein [Gemmataceae bacterium]